MTNSSQNAETVSILREMIRQMRDPHAAVQTLLPRLGTVQKHQAGAGYDIAPRSPQFQHLFLGLLPKEWQPEPRPAEEVPYYLEATLRPQTPLPFAPLAAAFGAWRPGIPSPEDSPFTVRFDHADAQQPESPYSIHLDVSLSGKPENPETQVKKVTITRERRL